MIGILLYTIRCQESGRSLYKLRSVGPSPGLTVLEEISTLVHYLHVPSVSVKMLEIAL